MADAIFPLDHAVSVGESFRDLTLLDRNAFEHDGRQLGIVIGCRLAPPDVDGGGQQSIAVGVRQQDDGLGDMADEFLGKTRLVVIYQRNDVSPGNVVMVDDGEAGGVEVVADTGNFPCRYGRANRAGEEQVRKREVVEVLRTPGDLLDALFSEDVRSDRAPPGHGRSYAAPSGRMIVVRPLVAVAACLIAITIAPCHAQTPTPNAEGPAAAGPRDGAARPVTVIAGYELHRDHQRYTFENLSNIDTEFFVPHSFTQTYVANNQWLMVSVRYAVRGDWMETGFALTPERQTLGWDLDTFYDPNDDVVVSGTTGEVLMRSWRFTHWSEARLLGLPWRMGYTYRRDRSQFLPTDRILTHSNPPSVLRSPTFGHETTYSQVHEFPIAVSKTAALPRTWSMTLGADASPLVWARLTTVLPDKYPGQGIVFDAKVIGAGGRIQLVRQTGRWPIALTLQYGRTWSHTSARQFKRDSLQASVGIGFE